jgi:hypothetical protein
LNRRVSSYRLSAPVAARALAAGLAATGLLVVVLVGLVLVLSLPRAVVSVGLAMAAVAVLALGLLATRRAVLLRLDDAGYRIRFVRGAGVRQAGWTQVENVAASTVAGQRCVVLRLRDGRTSTVPVDVLEGRPDDLVRDLQQHLDRGHGYRRLPRP